MEGMERSGSRTEEIKPRFFCGVLGDLMKIITQKICLGKGIKVVDASLCGTVIQYFSFEGFAYCSVWIGFYQMIQYLL